MNENDTTPSTAPAAAPRASKPSTRAAAPRGGSVALALLLALFALLASGYVGWRQWQQRQHRVADAKAMAAMQQRVAALESALASGSGGRANLAQRLDGFDQLDRTLESAQQAQGDRLRALEGAVGKLSESTLSAHDATLLDETESLLRMAKERYELFHDAQGAAAAYALAAQTLSAVNDGAFAGLRQNVEAERVALLASQPASQAEALTRLTALRETVPMLPLKPLDAPAGASSSGAWSRIARALTGVVSVQRDNGTPLAVADARFARELVALDLAQAQAALLAHDPKAYAAALQRADTGLANQFDGHSDDVQQAHAALKQLAGAVPSDTSVPLGAALTELRNLRAVHALSSNPSSAASAPAPAAAKGAAR
ncbi:uroporphyrinogen-III C-methyltransferase [Rhodanobacter sp. DHG33]|uniref:uroporphyrinogen-III C-methyltransferase n=1 Tax=Rhodanobacter sp. DHG33 TaxID=2775921 RepID=UPI00177AF796|nr:uroporphyrinogen-III C-methyltransferase [Rhodanobacter sp. DHG33]MBD8897396.1 uroporphyrinogen-III C-methyltransferase [Rhodanobacter sp. DHG33]